MADHQRGAGSMPVRSGDLRKSGGVRGTNDDVVAGFPLWYGRFPPAARDAFDQAVESEVDQWPGWLVRDVRAKW